jgi:hypothetical protein
MNDSDLLDRLRRKHRGRNTQNFGVLDFLAAFGSPLDALTYAQLFWPDFVQVEGMVLLAQSTQGEQDSEKVRETLVRHAGDRRRTEEEFNLVEIPSGVFTANLGETTDDQDRWLAETLASMWEARLRSRFPERSFTVRVFSPSETGGEVAVSFWQNREGDGIR